MYCKLKWIPKCRRCLQDRPKNPVRRPSTNAHWTTESSDAHGLHVAQEPCVAKDGSLSAGLRQLLARPRTFARCCCKVIDMQRTFLPQSELLPAGFHFLPGYLDDCAQGELAEDIRAVLRAAPLFTQRMPKTGAPLSVRMSNAGDLGWVTDKDRGYRYQANHPVSGLPWPAIPGSPHRSLESDNGRGSSRQSVPDQPLRRASQAWSSSRQGGQQRLCTCCVGLPRG